MSLDSEELDLSGFLERVLLKPLEALLRAPSTWRRSQHASVAQFERDKAATNLGFQVLLSRLEMPLAGHRHIGVFPKVAPGEAKAEYDAQ